MAQGTWEGLQTDFLGTPGARAQPRLAGWLSGQQRPGSWTQAQLSGDTCPGCQHAWPSPVLPGKGGPSGSPSALE